MDLNQLYEHFKLCNRVSIDSRTMQPNDMFFALKGDTHDGHSFVADVLKKNPRCVIIDNPDYQLDSRCILVPDSLIMLQELARYHRKQLSDTTVIAVVGSNGKTTTKNVIASVLATTYDTVATQGNYNNHIGVPLTVLSLPQTCEFAVIEMGANHPKEHAFLCTIAQPNAGIITNCGKDHLEGYGSIDGVIQANCELYDYLKETQGLLFVNYNDPILVENAGNAKSTHIIYYSDTPTDQENLLILGECTQRFPFIQVQLTHLKNQDLKQHVIHSHLLGDFQCHNILAAACIGAYYNTPWKAIKQGIESYIPENNRSQIIPWDSNTVILDAYNANPSSMTAMISYFSEYPGKTKALILGDMFELGTDSHQEHKNIISLIQEHSFELIILVGHNFKPFKDDLPCLHYHDVTELKSYLLTQAFKETVFLVKGSRGIGLEKAFNFS